MVDYSFEECGNTYPQTGMTPYDQLNQAWHDEQVHEAQYSTWVREDYEETAVNLPHNL